MRTCRFMQSTASVQVLFLPQLGSMRSSLGTVDLRVGFDFSHVAACKVDEAFFPHPLSAHS